MSVRQAEPSRPARRGLYAFGSAGLAGLGALMALGMLLGGPGRDAQVLVMALLIGYLAFMAAWRHYPNRATAVPGPAPSRWSRWRLPLLCAWLAGAAGEIGWCWWACRAEEARRLGWLWLERWVPTDLEWRSLIVPAVCFLLPALTAFGLAALGQQVWRRREQA